VIFPFTFPNGQVVDAGDAASHEAVFVELPVFVSVGAEPIAGVVVPLISKTDRDPITLKRPEFLDQTIFQFFVPFARQELHDLLATCKELRPVAPNAVWRVGERDTLRVTSIPGILGQPNFFGGGFGIEWGKGRSWIFFGFHVSDFSKQQLKGSCA